MAKMIGRIKLSRKELERVMRTQETIASQTALRLAETQRANILLRVNRGIGADDTKMPSYSRGYERHKRNQGRQSGRRDLSFSGSMLRDMHAVQTDTAQAKVLFGSGAQKLKALYNQELYPWFGISPNDQKLLSAELGRIQSEIKK